MKVIGRGAEAVLYLNKGNLVKERVSKSYRHKDIDLKLRKYNGRREARLLEKVSKVINVPKVLSYDEPNFKIVMEFIDGDRLVDVLDDMPTKKRLKICFELGSEIAKMHNTGIIHGDLTTSNFILKDKKIYFIDFGLGFHSTKVEDKAVDIHLLKQALDSKHYMHFDESFGELMKGYKGECDDFKAFMTRFEKVEKRGRYKRK